MKKIYGAVTVCSLLLLAGGAAAGQEFEINGGQSSVTSPSASGKKKTSGTARASDGIGWGSSIDVARQSRAAEDALKKGNYTAAANYAERALKSAPQNTRLWFLLGYAYRLGGKYNAAVEAFQHGLHNQPGAVEGLSGLAQTYARMGKSDEAKKLLLQIVAANPQRVNDLLIAGELFLQTGDYEHALPLLQRADALNPSARPEVLVASAYLKMKRPAEAKAWIDKAKKHGATAEVYRALAAFYRDSRQYEQAVEALKQIPRPSADVLGELGYTYQLAGDRDASAATYARAAQAAPKQVNLQLAAADAAFRVNKLADAEKFLNRAQALDANHYRLHALRGEMARADNRLGDAIHEYTLALSNMPESVPEGVLFPIQLRYNLGDTYQQAGDETAARQQFAAAWDKIKELSVGGPERPEFLRLRASIESAQGNTGAALKDLQEALSIDPQNPNLLLPYGSLLWKSGKKDEARKIFLGVLQRDGNNRWALSSLAYLARDIGANAEAEQYLQRYVKAYPKDFVGYNGLGDLYTSMRQFGPAEENYKKAYALNKTNPLIIAGAANASIESHNFKRAGEWLELAQGKMKDDPHVMLQTERWLTWIGRYRESAALGYKVIEKLPRDRDGAVYLGYSLYNLGRYDDVLRLVSRYENILPKEPNFPLLAGYVHKRSELLDEAVDDFSRAIARDPKMVEGYVNRGYTLNDTQNAEQAAQDFETALKLTPDNGVAHLGLAFSYLELHKAKKSLEHANQAEKLLGQSGSTHLAKAGAYRQQHLLRQAETEYRAALKYSPDDLQLHMALAETLYNMRRYGDSIAALQEALRLSPDDPTIYAQMAHGYAKMGRRDETMRYVEAAERAGEERSEILLATGDALMTLGDENGALQRFQRALEAPDADRVDARLMIARLFARDRKWDDARQQIGLAFAESRIGEASPVTSDNLLEAAGLFLSMRDFDLAERYYQRAEKAGAAPQVAAIGLANTYLALGDTPRAQAELASLGDPKDFEEDYDYQLAAGSAFRQRRENLRALGAYARANSLAGEDDIAERNLIEVAGEEGLHVTPRLSLHSDVDVHAIFEDSTIYIQDARISGLADGGGLLAPPRRSIETISTAGYKYHAPGLPDITGYFQVRNARGRISVPSADIVTDRDTWDYNWNSAINPVLRLGSNLFTFSTGLQFTLRRDNASPADMNQNLFRQFLYMNSNPLWNWLTVRGEAIHEAGPFTLRQLSSSDKSARLEFVVGRPWGKTELLTGYAVRDLQFQPLIREWFYTTTYVGLTRKFGEKLSLTGLAQYVRAWRVQDAAFTTAQVMEPAVRFTYRPNDRWTVEGDATLTRGQGFHSYDNIQNAVFISYVKPLRRMLDDGDGSVPVEYPIRFSFGLQQETFFNFTGRARPMVVPIVRLSLF